MLKILTFLENVFCWVAVAICLLVALLFPGKTIPLWIVTILLIVPITPVKKIRRDLFPFKLLRLLLAIILFLTSLLLTPTDDIQTVSDTLPVSEESEETETEIEETEQLPTPKIEETLHIHKETQEPEESESDILETTPPVFISKETETAEPEEIEITPPVSVPSEIKAPSTAPAETKVTQETETKAPEIKPQEILTPTSVPEETEPPITITHTDSSLTVENVCDLEGVAFFWAPSGNKVHLHSDCWSFQTGYIFAGTLEEAESVRTGGWCGICSKTANSETKTNPHATKEALADCYSYSDFLHGIPAKAFE